MEYMDDFFNKRVDGYEQHQLSCIECAKLFYPYTAKLLPKEPLAKVLDLGCGTGLELDKYFKINPQAIVTGIDLAENMLIKLQYKHKDKNLRLINASYFDVDFGKNEYDAVVSVESLHHFTFQEKINLYEKINFCLKENGYFVLTDYIAKNETEEEKFLLDLAKLKAENDFKNGLIHFDIPLTKEHENEALTKSGFRKTDILKDWGNTITIKAHK